MAVGEIIREEAAPSAETVAGEVGVELYFEDTDFKDIAGFGFGNCDRAGENVATGAAIDLRNLLVEIAEPRRDGGSGNALVDQALRWAAGGRGLHDDRIARVHGERRLCVRGVKAPGDSAGGGEQGVRLGILSRGRDGQNGCGGEQKGRAQGHDLV